MAKLIAVDFDGTLSVNNYPHIGKLIPENVSIMKKLHKAGYSFIIFSARLTNRPEDEKKIAKILKESDVPYVRITNKKPPQALAFIDDRAIKVTYNKPWPSDLVQQLDDIVDEHKKETNAQFYINFRKIALLKGDE